MGGYPGPLRAQCRGKVMRRDRTSAESTRPSSRYAFAWRENRWRIVMGFVTAAELEFHAFDVAHHDGHLCSLCSLVQQRHLAQVVGGLGGSLASALAVWSVLEAGVSLGALRLLRLLVHGAEKVLLLLLLTCRGRIYWCGRHGGLRRYAAIT